MMQCLGLFRRSGSLRKSSLTHLDSLTDLPNRLLLTDRLSQAIARARRQQERFAVLCMEIDRSDHANNSLSDLVGDELQLSIGKRLTAGVRLTDTVSRPAGDEFVVLLTGVTHEKYIAASAQQMLASVGQPHRIGENQVRVTASIGICVYPDDGTDAEALLENAHAAMLSAKNQGSNCYGFFKSHRNERAFERRCVENDLRNSLDRHEFELHYAPKVDFYTGATVGAEALVRWRRPMRGVALPPEFMSVAKQTGYVIPIGMWALRKVCQQTRNWLEAKLEAIPVSIDISATELRSRDFVQDVRAILHETGLDPRYLEFEVAEIALVKDLQSTSTVLHSLKDMGVQIALDNYGTGTSSLTYLKRVPVDALKIDSSLVRGLCINSSDSDIVDAVISAGRSFHLRVVAEGVETHQQFLSLQKQRCNEGQGGYFGAALPANEFAKFLEPASYASPNM